MQRRPSTGWRRPRIKVPTNLRTVLGPKCGSCKGRGCLGKKLYEKVCYNEIIPNYYFHMPSCHESRFRESDQYASEGRTVYNAGIGQVQAIPEMEGCPATKNSSGRGQQPVYIDRCRLVPGFSRGDHFKGFNV